MKIQLHEIECNEDGRLDTPDAWIPDRLEHNGYATPAGKAYTLYVLERP